jgi:hypothetical protein
LQTAWSLSRDPTYLLLVITSQTAARYLPFVARFGTPRISQFSWNSSVGSNKPLVYWLL